MLRSIALLVLTLGSTTVLADGFSYSFIGAGYARAEVVDETGDGFGIGGSAALGDNWHIFAGYQSLGFDFDIDLSALSAGVGFNTPISEKIDVVAQVAYLYAEADTPLGSVDDNGYGVSVGLRAWVSERVELDGSIAYSDFGDGGNDTSFGAGVQFYFTEQFSVGLGLGFADDVDTYTLGGRFYF
jgi:opacity protein-like surface antigen